MRTNQLQFKSFRICAKTPLFRAPSLAIKLIMLPIWITSNSSWVVNEVFLYFLVWKDQLASGINTMVWGQYKMSIILDQIPLYFLTKLETLKPHLDLLIFGLYSLLTFCKIGSSTSTFAVLVRITYNRAKLLFIFCHWPSLIIMQ